MKKFLDEAHPFPLFLVAVMAQGVLMLIDSSHEYIRVVQPVLVGWIIVNFLFLVMTTGALTPLDEERWETLEGYIHMSRWVSIWLIAATSLTIAVALYLR